MSRFARSRYLSGTVATVTVDGKGRIYIPKDIRDKLGIKSGDEVKLVVEGDRLVILVERRVKTLKRGRRWSREAFPDAGEALVSS